MEFNCKIRSLPADTLLNKVGYPSRWNGISFNCGRTFEEEIIKTEIIRKNSLCTGIIVCPECKQLTFMLKQGNYIIDSDKYLTPSNPLFLCGLRPEKNKKNLENELVAEFMLVSRSGTTRGLFENQICNSRSDPCSMFDILAEQNPFSPWNSGIYNNDSKNTFYSCSQSKNEISHKIGPFNTSGIFNQSNSAKFSNFNTALFGMLLSRSGTSNLNVEKPNSMNNFNQNNSTKFIGKKSNSSVLPLVFYDTPSVINFSKPEIIKILNLKI